MSRCRELHCKHCPLFRDTVMSCVSIRGKHYTREISLCRLIDQFTHVLDLLKLSGDRIIDNLNIDVHAATATVPK